MTAIFRDAVCTCWVACPAACTFLTQLRVLIQVLLLNSGTDKIFSYHCKYFSGNTTLVQWMLEQPGSEYWEGNSNQHHLRISHAFSFQEMWFYCMAGMRAQHLTQLHSRIKKECWVRAKDFLWMVELLRFITSYQQAVGLVWAMLNTGTGKTTLSLLLEQTWPVRQGSPQSHLPPDGPADMELN